MSRKFYCPVDVSNQYVSKEVKKWYCSVGGVSKKVKKAYCSVGGLSKLFYEDGGGSSGHTKIVFLENYSSGTTYDLEYADIGNTIRYYIEELNYINQSGRAYAETMSSTEMLPRFFMLLDLVTDAVEDIVTYIGNQINTENEIYISSALIKSSAVYTLRINFDIYTSSLTGKTVAEPSALDVVGSFFRYRATPTTSRSGKRIQLNITSSTRRIEYTTTTNTRTVIQIGQSGSSYNSSPPYVYPLFISVGNVGIDFAPNDLPNYYTRWDFANQMSFIDKADNVRATISGARTVIGSGAVHIGDSDATIGGSPSWAIELPTANHSAVIEVDIAEMDLQTTSDDAVLLRLRYDTGSGGNTKYEEFIYSVSEQIWMLHTRNGSTHTYGRSNISDMNYFENSTIKFILSTTTVSVYKDNLELICDCNALSRTDLSGGFGMGDHINNIGVKSIRSYST